MFRTLCYVLIGWIFDIIDYVLAVRPSLCKYVFLLKDQLFWFKFIEIPLNMYVCRSCDDTLFDESQMFVGEAAQQLKVSR